MNVKGLKDHLNPFIDLIKLSRANYFWIASGVIRDYFVTGGVTPKDIDIFFPDTIQRDKAIKFLNFHKFKCSGYLPRKRGQTFELTKDHIPDKFVHLSQGDKYSYHSIDIGCWDGKSGECKAFAKTPQQCIDWFDFTIEMAYLDSDNKFDCHPDYKTHITNKTLVFNSKKNSFPRGNNRRLLKYIKEGFTIDQNNLLLWLEDQEAAFDYRH